MSPPRSHRSRDHGERNRETWTKNQNPAEHEDPEGHESSTKYEDIPLSQILETYLDNVHLHSQMRTSLKRTADNLMAVGEGLEGKKIGIL